jgi:hypothetical protein
LEARDERGRRKEPRTAGDVLIVMGGVVVTIGVVVILQQVFYYLVFAR